jgi:hypothetical protein
MEEWKRKGVLDRMGKDEEGEGVPAEHAEHADEGKDGRTMGQ